MAYVEVPSPKDLFGPNHKPPHGGSGKGRSNSSRPGPSKPTVISSPIDNSDNSRPPSPREPTPKKRKAASRPDSSIDQSSSSSPAKSTPRGSPNHAGSSKSLPSMSNSPSPKKPSAGVARRMLSRTESFPLEAPEPPSTPLFPLPPATPQRVPIPKHVTQLSRNNSLSRRSPPSTTKSNDASPSSVTTPRKLSPSPSRPVARTYAKSRSFLVDLSSTLLEPGAQTTDVRESYSDLRARWGVDAMENETQENGLLPNDVKSVTDLMNKGETRRFMDEVGYLFEGLGPEQTLSVRRST